MDVVLLLPFHKVAGKWEQECIHCTPCDEDGKVDTKSGVEAK